MSSILRISQAANVSYATAWRIINKRPCRSPEAVKAVKAAMEKLGYTPANGRRGRRPKAADGIRTHNIALLNLRQGTSISTSVLNAVQRMLAERNLNLIFAHVEGPQALPQAIRSGNVDGILGYGQFPATAVTDALRRTPAVWMMSRTTREGADIWGDRVKPDHQVIGELAAGYLLKRGHTQVAFFNPQPGLPIHTERSGAFSAALEGTAATLQVMTAQNPSGSVSEAPDAAEQLVKQWMAASPRPTGVFIPIDRFTLRAYRYLQKHGIEIGRDIDIISCDNETELLSLMHPRPASIDLNRQTIARHAVERLFWRMKNGMSSPAIHITVSPTLDLEHVPAMTGNGG